MKKLQSLIFFIAVVMLTSCVSSPSSETIAAIEPTKLDVESFIDTIDITMDISHLSLSDCRILRNAFAARVGYPFRDAYLRGVFQTTTWYDSLMWAFDGNDENFTNRDRWDSNKNYRDNYYDQLKDDVIHYTEEQLDFIGKLKQREEELMKHNFDVAEGYRVNISNLLNPAQLVEFDEQLQEKLAQNGFAIVPADHQQLFHVYEQNDYTNMPNFVTTDLYLQLFHLYFDCMLRDVEEYKFFPLLRQFCDAASSRYMDDDETSLWLITYFKVANALLEGKAPEYDTTALEEYNKVMKSEDAFSEYLGYTNAQFAYSLFRPRGHYTRNDTLQRYFRTMMWLQTVPFQTDSKADMLKVFSLANKIGNPNYTEEYQLYKKLTEPMTWLMGQPDDVSILQVGKIVNEMDQSFLPEKLDDMVDVMTRKIDELAEKQTRIRPKFQRTGRNKVRLMPQRYQPDAEVLQEMVDYDSKPTKRATPKGLDVFAAMGVSAAEQVLMDEKQEWKDFGTQLKKMKQRMTEIDWQETIATQWLNTLTVLNTSKPDGQPYFMATPEWELKDLNATLSSWAELKHDAILYAKQPMGAECGGGGPPDPVVKGYVEPNTGFWKKAIELLDNTAKLLREQGMMTPKIAQATERIGEELHVLLRVSEKELAGQEPTDEEYDQLKCVGAMFENISLDLIREPDQYLMGWDDVQGADRKVALVADVYTANADNNPEKSILYEAVGNADEIYVIVEIDGCLYLTRGAVLSYREFIQPSNLPRLTDEEWQQQLEKNPRKGVPEWMNRIIVPLKQQPTVNEEFFYSSGC